MSIEFRSGDALFAFDGEMKIVSWNRAAEELTGVAGADAIGKACWEIIGGIDDDGSLVCHSGCSGARLAGEGWPVRSQKLLVKTGHGTRKDVWMSTIAVRNADAPLYVHVLRNGHEVASATDVEPVPGRPTRLTSRQLEVLTLIDEGHSAKAIADKLAIAEPTVRNHIRSILLELGCHSQLEALAVARRRHLL